MSSSQEYIDFIIDQLSGLKQITLRKMMGEYIIYYRGKIIGGVYDDRFLIKPAESAKKMMPDAVYEAPYEGAKEMMLVDTVDDKSFLKELIEKIWDELPYKK